MIIDNGIMDNVLTSSFYNHLLRLYKYDLAKKDANLLSIIHLKMIH